MAPHPRQPTLPSSILEYPTSPSPIPDAVPDDAPETADGLACVICYTEKNRDPEVFYMQQNAGFISFTDDASFVQATEFYETQYEIFVNSIGEFLPLTPDNTEWRFPSQRYSFFLLKNGGLMEDECPKLDDWVMLLMDDIDNYIKLRASSPLPPSSPPPESAPAGTAPVEHHDASTQTGCEFLECEGPYDIPRGIKRKFCDVEGIEITGRNVKINLNVIVKVKGRKRPSKRNKEGGKGRKSTRSVQILLGTGERNDPIDVE